MGPPISSKPRLSISLSFVLSEPSFRLLIPGSSQLVAASSRGHYVTESPSACQHPVINFFWTGLASSRVSDRDRTGDLQGHNLAL